MAKIKTEFECQSCGYKTAKWEGKCPDCGQWNSLLEVEKLTKQTKSSPGAVRGRREAKKITEVTSIEHDRIKTGIEEFDRVVGGGLTIGSLSLLGGEPGIGKSTLLLEVCGKVAKNNPNDLLLYVSGEESESQIADRAKRLGVDSENILILHETQWQEILAVIKDKKPKFFVLDSIQTTVSNELTSASGTVSQVREVTYDLMNHAKALGITCFVIGHVTKEGGISGPKVLEHMVDTVLFFEGDQNNFYRLLRVQKNRFGNTYEVGIFEMTENGLGEVHNPSQYFLEKSFQGAFGRSITCVLEGTRSIFVETQALVTENKYGNGRRTTQGIDNNRLAMLVAIIEKYFEIPLGFHDIYVNVVGGIKLSKRDSDLAIIAAILSSYYSKPLDEKTVLIAEVGLTGEIRKAPMMESRIKEMDLLKYEKLITSSYLNDEIQKKYDVCISGIERITDLKKLLF